ncbi:E3 ubiquitin-protein ligase [Forsythia ovata]|uniref:E3 ubiquitin-protein ligase n=1 Tax=Forsythia ovata TaxID=205694 RepID=A0ABD1UXC5_9LAMI
MEVGPLSKRVRDCRSEQANIISNTLLSCRSFHQWNLLSSNNPEEIITSGRLLCPPPLCEICGKTVKNKTSNLEDTSIFMMEWNKMRIVATTLDTSQECSLWCKKSLCNLLMASLVLAFVYPGSFVLIFSRGCYIRCCGWSS